MDEYHPPPLFLQDIYLSFSLPGWHTCSQFHYVIQPINILKYIYIHMIVQYEPRKEERKRRIYLCKG
jgi:hypothetical protein